MFINSVYLKNSQEVFESDSPDTRVDFCAGQFKHISKYFIDTAEIIVLDETGLVIQQLGGKIPADVSPKSFALSLISHDKVNLKSLIQHSYHKTLKAVDGELDGKGNQLWEVESVQVVYTIHCK